MAVDVEANKSDALTELSTCELDAESTREVIDASGHHTELLPQGSEVRLERFSEFVGFAIDTANAREAVRLLADEQAALRRVATLVTRRVPPAKIVMAVSEEVARLFGEDLASVGKFDRAAPAMTFVGLSTHVKGVAIGARVELSDETPSAQAASGGPKTEARFEEMPGCSRHRLRYPNSPVPGGQNS